MGGGYYVDPCKKFSLFGFFFCLLCSYWLEPACRLCFGHGENLARLCFLTSRAWRHPQASAFSANCSPWNQPHRAALGQEDKPCLARSAQGAPVRWREKSLMVSCVGNIMNAPELLKTGCGGQGHSQHLDWTKIPLAAGSRARIGLGRGKGVTVFLCPHWVPSCK